MASNELRIHFTIDQYDELMRKLNDIANLTKKIVDNLDVIRVRETHNNGEE